MPFITVCCPHPRCGANPSTLLVLKNYVQDKGGVVLFCICPGCELPVSLALKPGPHATKDASWFAKYDTENRSDLISASGWIIDQIVPPLSPVCAPEHTPMAIARLYRQARSSLRRGEHVAARILLERVVTDTLSTLDEHAPGSVLQRIDDLVVRDRLPRYSGDWMREVECHASASDASTALLEFTDMLLLATFTMPGRYAGRRSDPRAADRAA